MNLVWMHSCTRNCFRHILLLVLSVSMLIVILFLGCYTMWMWAMLLAFERYTPPSFLGSKRVGWQISVYTQLYFVKGGEGQ
jgi:hypothetical protein